MGYSLNEIGAKVASLQGSPFVSPAQFGAIGDGSSHPASTVYGSLEALHAAFPHPFATDLSQELDYLGWQMALVHGGAVGCTGLETYVMCNANPASQNPLTVIAGLSWGYGNGAHLTWPELAPAATPPPLNADPNFWQPTGSSPWRNSALYSPDEITDFVFGGGAATYTDPASFEGVRGNFGSMGQQVSRPAGRYTAVITYNVSLGASYAFGNFNQPIWTFGFQTAVGDGNNPFGASASLDFSSIFAGGANGLTASFDFASTADFTHYLCAQGGGYGSLQITSIEILPWAPNCGLLLTRDGATDHYPVYQPMAGLNLIGPASTVDVVATRWKSFNDVDGNLAVLRDTKTDGWGTAMSLEDGAYLTQMFGVEVNNCGLGIDRSRPGRNSGENFTFFGGGINNSGACVQNASGGEFHFFGTSFDYCGQVILNNSGRVELHGLRCEMHLPQGEGQPAFECLDNGRINVVGGYLLAATPAGAEPPIRLRDAGSRMELYGTQVYGYTSTSGLMCSGEGMLIAHGWLNSGNPGLGMISAAASMDVFGGAGDFEPPAFPLFGGDPSGIGIDGGLYSQGYETIDKWNSSGMTVAPSTDYAFTGTRSLKITKLAAADAASHNNELHILIPISQGKDALFGGRWLAPENVGTGIAEVYYRAYQVQVIGRDSFNRPIFGPQSLFRGEANLEIDLTGEIKTWAPLNINTVYASPQGQAWTTHIDLVFDTQSIPALSFYLDGLLANVL